MTAELPPALSKEIEGLRDHFEIRPTVVPDQVTLAASVRGVAVELRLAPTVYPARPPEVFLAAGWSWKRLSALNRARRIKNLESLNRWNRTLGVGTLLRDLEVAFRDTPPRRSKVSALGQRVRKNRENVRALFASWTGGLRTAWRRLFGKKHKELASPELSSGTDLRSNYEALIHEKTVQIRRYREALAGLELQWEKRKGKIRQQEDRVEQLARSREEALQQSGQVVHEMQSAGNSVAAIKTGEPYRTGLAAYADHSIHLSEECGRLEEYERDAEKLHGKLREHEAQLEAQVKELEDLQEEAHDVETELILTQLDQELLDIRSGVRTSELARQREATLLSVRDKRAKLRVTRRLADREADSEDREYLERGRKVSATREFDALLGLEEGSASVDEPRPRALEDLEAT